MKNASVSSLLLLGLIGAIWGGSFSLIKVALQELSPLQVVVLRTGFAAIAMLPLALVGFRHSEFRCLSTIGRIILLSMIGYVTPFFLIAWGELFVPSNIAAVIMAAGPLIAFVVARATGVEQMSVAKAVGLLFGFSGIVILAWSGRELALVEAQRFGLGFIAVLLATLCYVGAGFLTKSLNQFPSTVLTCFTLGIAWLMSLVRRAGGRNTNFPAVK